MNHKHEAHDVGSMHEASMGDCLKTIMASNLVLQELFEMVPTATHTAAPADFTAGMRW
jgi:hypothetical protein